MKIKEGARLGHYNIRSQIGAGGMGEVYLGCPLDLDVAANATSWKCYIVDYWCGRGPLRILPGL